MKFNGILLFIFSILYSCNVQHSLNSVPFRVIEKSQYGTEMTAQQRLIDSQKEFSALHRKIYANTIPPPEIPQINFKNKRVIFLHFGTFSHGGNTFKADSIKYVDNTLEVYLTTGSPGPGQPALTVMTYPYMLLEIEKTETVPQKIKIIKNKK